MRFALVSAALAFLFVDRFDEPRFCTIVADPFFAYDSSTYMLALPLPDTLRAGKGPIEDTRRPGHYGWAERGTPVFGQRFQLLRHGGATEPLLDSLFLTTGRRDVVLVLWDYDSACEPTKWAGSAQWASVESPVFVLGGMRPRNRWTEGRPTFDILFAYKMVYVAHTFLDDLTPGDVFTLVDELPKPCDWHARPDEARRMLSVVKDKYSDLLKQRSGHLIISEHDRWAQEVGWNDLDPSLLAACAA